MNRLTTASFLLFFLFLFIPASAQEVETTASTLEKAEEAVQGFFNENDIPGMSVSVSREGELVWSKGFGYADLENEIPIEPSKTLFRIGSVSKTYTAAAVGLLMQEGKLDLDKPVQTYVPYFPEKRYTITVEQVAGHLAGIRHYRGDEFMSDKKYETIEEGIGIFKDDTLLFEPGTDYSYSSYGWNLVSGVVEGASGEEFLTYMEEHVFGPLDMKNSMPDHADQDIPNRTMFYEWSESDSSNTEAPYVDNSYKWAGGGFLSTTEDMVTFGEAHLSNDFLNQETKKRLMAPLQTSDGKSTNYGIGWATIMIDGEKWMGHTGGSVGGTTLFMMHPGKKIVIAFAINRSRAGGGSLRDELAAIFSSY